MEKSVTTKMRTEALESPNVINQQIETNTKIIENIAEKLIFQNPYSTVSIARGSSDHASQYLNYLIMDKLGLLTTSLSLSILTLYQTKLNVKQSVSISISQSGQSPDVIIPTQFFKENALSAISLVNDIQSPLTNASSDYVGLLAGKENSVAATKSFIASLSTAAQLVSAWSKDKKLSTSMLSLSDDLFKAQQMNWCKVNEKLIHAKRIMVVGRGYGLSLALEAALKFKETCSIQAEAFSAAEIKHGPQALIENGYPLIIFANRGPALHSMLDLALDMKDRGANVILAAPEFVKEKDICIYSTQSEELDILSAAQSFYLMIEKLSLELGLNPDEPKHLSKVTKTK
jgi:glucosamine--fructose-6-phosphate aminotransferase (isomerizing)